MLWWLIQTPMIAAVLAGLVYLACRVTRCRPAVQHMLWLVVLIKLVAPPLLSWPWSVSELVPASFQPLLHSSRDLAADGSLRVSGRVESIVADPHGGNAVAVNGSEVLAIGRGPQKAAQLLTSIDIGTAIRWIWIVGVVVACGYQVRRILLGSRLCRRTEKGPAWLTFQVRQVASALQVPEPPVSVSHNATTPFIWCLGRPRLIWPAALTEDIDGTRWRGVIAHELAHIKRRDHWGVWVELIGFCLWWWNPLFWYVRRRLHETSEMACDAWAVRLVDDARRDYAEALLDVSQLAIRQPLAVSALGASTGELHTFERRLTMIFSERVSCGLSWTGFLSACLMALFAVPAWSLGEGTTAKPSGPKLQPVAQGDAQPAAEKKRNKVTPEAASETKPASDRKKERILHGTVHDITSRGGVIVDFGELGKKGQRTYQTGADTEITIDGKPAKVSDLKPGFRVTLTLDDNAQQSPRVIRAEGPMISGRLKSVHPITSDSKGSLTLIVETSTAVEETTFEMSEAPIVFIHGKKEAGLSDLPPGSEALVRLSVDRRKVMAVSVGHGKRGVGDANKGATKDVDRSRNKEK